MSEIDQQFVEYVVKSLVSHPDDVVVERTIDEKGVLLKLNVNPEDIGRVIGKRGVTAQSIRTLLRALGTKNDARYNFKIIDDGDENKPRRDEEPRDEKPKEDKPAEEPADDTSTDEPVEEPEEEEEEVKEEQSLADKTREELAEFDDLDI